MLPKKLIFLLIFFAQGYISRAQHPINTKQKHLFHNPVIDQDFPDPTLIRGTNGNYYAYATQGSVKGKMLNIQVAMSKDMFHWSSPTDAMPVKPVWADKTADFWAPHVLYDSVINKYVLFFSSATNDTSTGKCMGVAFSESPVGPFIDKGSPLICGDGFINIDPMVFVDPLTKKKLLFWGSGFQPLKVQQLTDDWQHFMPSSQPRDLAWPGKEKSYTNLLEGAWLDYHGGKYYLYYSGDNCCGEKANYAVMVSRADSVLGPYTRLGETNASGSSVILEKDKRWSAPGHNSVFTDDAGNKWIAYHAIDKSVAAKKGQTRRVMLINRIVYMNGWPKVIR